MRRGNTKRQKWDKVSVYRNYFWADDRLKGGFLTNFRLKFGFVTVTWIFTRICGEGRDFQGGKIDKV